MHKGAKAKHKHLTWRQSSLLWVAVYMVYAAVMYVCWRHSLMYAESLGTFHYDLELISQSETFGITDWAERFVIQFYADPVGGTAITALLLTLGTWLLNFIVQFLLRRHKSLRMRVIITGVITLVTATTLVCTADRDNDLRYQVAVASAAQDWDGVIGLCTSAHTEDPEMLNSLNLALANRGRLAYDMFRYNSIGPESLIMRRQTPEAFTVLSDVYYTIGLVSAAQFYAFQANEACGNLSPRLLKRLVDTNIIYGQYDVARKYLNVLESTLFYRSWARDRRDLLYNDRAVETHAELGPKRACLFADDRFIAQRGIDDDIMQIMLANPSHQPAWQYLGCFYILAKDLPRLMQMLDRMRAAGTLPDTLPTIFQQAVCTAALASGNTDSASSPVSVYGIPAGMVDACRDFWSNRRNQPGTAWQYLRDYNLR